MSDGAHDPTVERKRVLAKKLDAAGWGVFFVWIGIALLAALGWGIGLLGVGIITLGGQLARKVLGIPVEGFALLVGAVFVAGGLWELFDLREAAIPGGIVPILFIAAGAVLLASALRTPRGQTG